MTAKELARLVKSMREVQKRFFAGERSSELIRQAKDWERRTDKAVAEVLDDRPSLFAEEP